jgi:hypothetical protein
MQLNLNGKNFKSPMTWTKKLSSGPCTTTCNSTQHVMAAAKDIGSSHTKLTALRTGITTGKPRLEYDALETNHRTQRTFGPHMNHWNRRTLRILLMCIAVIVTTTAQAQTTEPNDAPDTPQPTQPAPSEFQIGLGLSGYVPVIDLDLTTGNLHVEIEPSLDLIGRFDQVQLQASVFVYLDENLTNTFDLGLGLGASNLVRDRYEFPLQGCSIEATVSLRLYTRSVAGCAIALEKSLILTTQLQITRSRIGTPGAAGTLESALTYSVPFVVSLVPDAVSFDGIHLTVFGVVRGIGYGGAFGGGGRINLDLNVFGQQLSPGIEFEALGSLTSIIPSGFKVSIVVGSGLILRPGN